VTKLVVGSATDVGMVRSNNQDQYLVAPGLYAVADGMGGHAAGEVASQTAIEALGAAFDRAVRRSPQSLVEAAKTANRAVWDQARANRGMLGMGTTLVALAVVEDGPDGNGMAIAHIGDSRAYVFRDGELRQLTTDHSLVQELVDDGQISEEEAAVHPQRHVLTRALGVEPSVEVDLLPLEPRHGDRYLLCSDGLPREASADQIAAVLSRFGDPAEAAKELVSLANARGGSDNVTVVVVDVLASDPTGETLMVVPAPAASTVAATSALPAVARPVPSSGGPGTGPVDEGRPRPGRRRSGAAGGRPTPRPVTFRVIGFVVAFCLVVGGAIAGLGWYARSTYYVALSGGHIDIFQGRPGGVLWFKPTLAEKTSYTAKSVLAYQVADLEAGHLEGSLGDARSYISRLVARKKAAEKAGRPPGQPTTSTIPAKHPRTTSSTVPARQGPTTTTVPVPPKTSSTQR
jgi:protein phosphatase